MCDNKEVCRTSTIKLTYWNFTTENRKRFFVKLLKKS